MVKLDMLIVLGVVKSRPAEPCTESRVSVDIYSQTSACSISAVAVKTGDEDGSKSLAGQEGQVK